MIVIVNEKAIQDKAKKAERARIVTELALAANKLKGAERRGFFKAARLIARMDDES